MMRKMWLATRQFARWVKVHSPGSGYDNLGYSERLDYLNGGVGMRGSLASHGERTLVWNRVTAEEAREIADFADGIYGDGPYYLIDPVSATQNVLDKQWATPALTGKDGVPLIGLERPQLVRNYDTSRGYPIEMARYDYADIGGSRTAYIPIPPGHVAWVGVHGDRESTGGLDVQPTSGEFPVGLSTTVPVADVNAPLFSHSFPATSEHAGIELSFKHGGPIVNHATAPSFEESDGTVTLYENLFTNPSFEAGSGTVEVRRNLCPDPSFEGASVTAWTTSGGATFAQSTEWAVYGAKSAKVVAGNANSNAGDLRIGSLTSFPPGIGPGSTVTVSAEINIPAAHTAPDSSGSSRQRRILLFAGTGAGGTTVITSYGPQVPNTPGRHRISHTMTIPNDATGFIYAIGCAGSGSEPNFVTYVDAVLVEVGSQLRPYFDGSVQSVPDPDLTPAWTSAPDASESILTGVPVAGVTAVRCLAIRSSKFGGSMRLIPNTSNTDSYAYFILPTAARGGGTLIATRHQEQVITTTNGRRGALGAEDSRLFYSYPTIQVGSEEMRLTYPALTSFYHARFYHGGAQGSGDVYWTMGGLFEGEYTGPWFDGAHPINDPDFITAWSGTPNASTSTVSAVKAMLPAGSSAYNCIPVRSTRGVRSGAFSLRLISTGAGAFVIIPRPGALSAGGVARVTAFLQEPLSTISEHFPSLTVSDGATYDSVPNIPGFHDLEIEVPGGTSDLLLTGAFAQGVGDVWYDALGLFEPGRAVAWFDGDSDGAAWDGTPHQSSSTLTTRRVTIAGIIVQIHPAGVTPPDGKFISGQGISGFQFEGKPQVTPYSLAHDSFGLSAKIVEVETWL